ncbi:MAG: polyprenyl synthetase family protein [Halobacteriales archaeon]|nr:polyprenyl synthetase family protein [Halobacteriales archaeon]
MTAPGREERVLSAVAARRERVNAALDDYLPVEHPHRLYEAARYLLEAGGKRLRPTVLLLVSEALLDVEPLSTDYTTFPTVFEDGPAEIDVMAAAVAVEIIQSFTLIHDDIMDDDDLRRGVPSVHHAYDLETAILAGDTLYSKAFEVMLATGSQPTRSLRALAMLATTCTEICEGQALDVEFEGQSDVGVEAYLDMIERKTASLYAASAGLPTVLLGADQETTDAMVQYGRSIGRAFQIQDDVLDLTVPSETLGKRRGSDLIEGKRTLITLHARDNGVDVDGLLPDAPADAISETDIDEAVSRLEEAGSIQFASEKAHDLAEQGKDELAVFPENEARSTLSDLADYLVERGY